MLKVIRSIRNQYKVRWHVQKGKVKDQGQRSYVGSCFGVILIQLRSYAMSSIEQKTLATMSLICAMCFFGIFGWYVNFKLAILQQYVADDTFDVTPMAACCTRALLHIAHAVTATDFRDSVWEEKVKEYLCRS
ncbi:hypothetical protein L1987_24502 [Smallanthus sonchifolius]|uniref:Uncharacterized protein n=1 Tax=Smallanthus sonchifolius TaxID=185202 RepID=A0ACB9IKT8_9ASTR|nr:hypothetical protein L1987_24502 [Smallanthus sonchifolius]